MKKHIFIDTIIEKFCDSEMKHYYQEMSIIDNAEAVLLVKPLTEITHYLHDKFKNHTLIGNTDSRNFYAFDTNEGILLVYPPIPFGYSPELNACYVTYYKDKQKLKDGFLSISNTIYDEEELHPAILNKIEKISPSHDDSNSVKNIMGRIANIRKSKAPIIFDKPKTNF